MPELPDRPDLDQLRRQARELLRAAVNGEPHAVTRLSAVSGRMVLSAAQLAVAREYGFPSWPVLKAVVERRRSAALAAGPPLPGGGWRRVSHRPEERWSFGGAAPIETTGGVLVPDLLIIGPGRAILGAFLAHPEPAARQSAGEAESLPSARRVAPLSQMERLEEAGRLVRAGLPRLDDITVSDDRGARYALRLDAMSDHRHQPGGAAGPSPVRVRVEPAPEPGAAWFELRHRDGPATRFLPSPQAAVQVSQVTPTPASAAESELGDLANWLIETRLASPSADLARQCSIVLTRAAEIREAGGLGEGSELLGQLARLCAAMTGERPAAGLPPAWSGMLGAADRADGARLHVDIGSAVPALSGVVTRLDSLSSGPGTWRLFLRAVPEWFAYSEDGRRKWTPVSVYAEDDLGGGYVSRFGGSSGQGDHVEVTLTFLPRLDPLARRLTLTLRGGAEKVAVVVDFPVAGLTS